METVIEVADIVDLDYGEKYLKKIDPRCRNIGEGCYARVFSKKKYDYVWKVFGDDNYKEYLEIAKCLPHNPFVPRIYEHIKIIGAHIIDEYDGEDLGPSIVNLVKMEKLSPLAKEREDWTDIAIGIEGSVYSNKPEKFKSYLKGKKKLYSYFCELVDHLYYIKQEFDVCIDIHDENIMMRGKQFVITDPFS